MRRQLFVWSIAPGPRAGTLASVVGDLSHGRLRCGWGVAPPAVAGQLDTPSGDQPERLASQPAGASDPEPSHAVGGRPVWCRLREMSVGDVVFLPKSPDDGHFMVATVQRPDACERATVMDEADGRHACRQVLGVAETMR